MKFGLKYSFTFPNSVKLNNISNLLLSGFGVGGAFAGVFDNPKCASVMIGVGLIAKGLATFSTDNHHVDDN
jgi:hypothetical protein